MSENFIPEIGPGILMPMIKNRFRVIFNTNIDAIDNTLTSQVTKCNIDYVKRLFTVTIEQNRSDALIHKGIKLFLKHNIDIFVLSMDGECHAESTVELRNCKLIDHSFYLDYAISEVASHELTFSFDINDALFHHHYELDSEPVVVSDEESTYNLTPDVKIMIDSSS